MNRSLWMSPWKLMMFFSTFWAFVKDKRFRNSRSPNVQIFFWAQLLLNNGPFSSCIFLTPHSFKYLQNDGWKHVSRNSKTTNREKSVTYILYWKQQGAAVTQVWFCGSSLLFDSFYWFIHRLGVRWPPRAAGYHILSHYKPKLPAVVQSDSHSEGPALIQPGTEGKERTV